MLPDSSSELKLLLSEMRILSEDLDLERLRDLCLPFSVVQWIPSNSSGKREKFQSFKFLKGHWKIQLGENSIFNEIVKYGSNKVLFGANWDIQCHFSFLLSVRPQKIKNTKNKKQKNWFFEGLQKVRMKNEVGNLNLHQKVPIWT